MIYKWCGVCLNEVRYESWFWLNWQVTSVVKIFWKREVTFRWCDPDVPEDNHNFVRLQDVSAGISEEFQKVRLLGPSSDKSEPEIGELKIKEEPVKSDGETYELVKKMFPTSEEEEISDKSEQDEEAESSDVSDTVCMNFEFVCRFL